MRLLITFLILILTGCSHFHTGRSYLSEMEHDDTSYFDAGSDFPIVTGDSGETWRSESEQGKRTPASEDDLALLRRQRMLKKELQALEAAQTEHGHKIYEKHRKKFGTVSEKIYFLKLTQSQRIDYLDSRGFLEGPPQGNPTPFERMHAQRQSNVILGMSKQEVHESWGRPLRVEVAGNPSYENERWVYSSNGATKYIYFESGRVEGWE